MIVVSGASSFMGIFLISRLKGRKFVALSRTPDKAQDIRTLAHCDAGLKGASISSPNLNPREKHKTTYYLCPGGL